MEFHVLCLSVRKLSTLHATDSPTDTNGADLASNKKRIQIIGIRKELYMDLNGSVTNV